MKKFVSRQWTTSVLLFIFSFVILFHILVITGLIPFDIVWGGRLQSREHMIQFESISISLNLLMLVVVVIEAGYVKLKVNPMLMKIILWIMVVLFAMNTIGNLFSNNFWEKIIFTPITLFLSLSCLRLVIAED